MDALLGCLGLIVLAIGLSIGMALLYSVPVWLLWNWLMPYIFELPAITFWQALGLSVLCSFLFKSSSTSSNSSKS
jgi:uncharacterized membrane protein SpoIIM required for sporulation